MPNTLTISTLPVEFIFFVHEKSGDIDSIVHDTFSIELNTPIQHYPIEVILGKLNPLPIANIIYLTLFFVLFLIYAVKDA